MKYVKILSLAAVAAAALMALIGPSSALATGSTALCKKNETPCATGNLYPSGTVIKGATKAGSKALLTTKASGTVECDSSFVANTTATTANPLPVDITALTWVNCTLNGNPCTVTSVNLPYSADLTDTSPPPADLTVTGNPGATVTCGVIINCTYTASSPVLKVTGGEAGVANAAAEKVALTGTGKACPNATWDGTYFLSEPTPVCVSS